MYDLEDSLWVPIYLNCEDDECPSVSSNMCKHSHMAVMRSNPVIQFFHYVMQDGIV